MKETFKKYHIYKGNNTIEENNVIIKGSFGRKLYPWKNIINLKYLSGSKEIILFGEKFIQNNNKKARNIINNKRYKLKEKLESRKDNQIIKIKLEVINDFTDLSFMFKNSNLIVNNQLDKSDKSDISKLNTEKVKNMSNLFCGCTFLTKLPDISNWKTNNVKFMNNLFNGCSNLISLPDISKWKLDNVQKISSLFNDCSKLTEIPI